VAGRALLVRTSCASASAGREDGQRILAALAALGPAATPPELAAALDELRAAVAAQGSGR
jgi:hypothetical protein